MKKILVPFDFSEPANNAYQQALNMATRSGGNVHLLHVVEPSEEEKAKVNAEAKFKDLIKRIGSDHSKTKFEVKIGSISDTIQQFIKDQNIDLVIMGSTGASGLKEVFVGSNAEKVVRQSPVPVLIVKKYFDQPIRRIVFPTTLEHREELIMKVKELQHFFKARLCLVYINTQFGLGDESATAKHLQEFANRYMLKDYSIHVHNHTSIEKGVIEFTKTVSGDMIALGTHGHTGVVHLVKGSIAEDIVNHTERLIWTYRMKGESAEKQN